MEGTHSGFIRQITGKRARWQEDREWETPAAKDILLAAGMQSEAK